MNRLIACGFAVMLFGPLMIAGCGPSVSQQRDQAIGAFRTNHFDEARSGFDQIIAHGPDAESYYYLGRIYHIEAQYSKAIINYQNCLTADPSYASAKMWLKRALEDFPAGRTLLFIPMPDEQTAKP